MVSFLAKFNASSTKFQFAASDASGAYSSGSAYERDALSLDSRHDTPKYWYHETQPVYTISDFLRAKPVGVQVEDKAEGELTAWKKSYNEKHELTLAYKKKQTEAIPVIKRELCCDKIGFFIIQALQISMLAIAVLSLTSSILLGCGAVVITALSMAKIISYAVFATSVLFGVIIMPHIYQGASSQLEETKSKLKHAVLVSGTDYQDQYPQVSERDPGLKTVRSRYKAERLFKPTYQVAKPSDEEILQNQRSEEEFSQLLGTKSSIDYRYSEWLKKLKALFDENPESMLEASCGFDRYYKSLYPNYDYENRHLSMLHNLNLDLYEDVFLSISGIENRKELKELFYLRLFNTNLILMINALEEPGDGVSEDYRQRFELLKSYKTSAVGKFFEKEDAAIIFGEEKIKKVLNNFSYKLYTSGYQISFTSHILSREEGFEVKNFFDCRISNIS